MQHYPVSIFPFYVSRFIFIPFTNLRYQSKNSHRILPMPIFPFRVFRYIFILSMNRSYRSKNSHQNTSLCQFLSSTFLDTSSFSMRVYSMNRPLLLTLIFLTFPRSFLFNVLRIVLRIISVTRSLGQVWVKKRRKERGTPSIHAT